MAALTEEHAQRMEMQILVSKTGQVGGSTEEGDKAALGQQGQRPSFNPHSLSNLGRMLTFSFSCLDSGWNIQYIEVRTGNEERFGIQGRSRH